MLLEPRLLIRPGVRPGGRCRGPGQRANAADNCDELAVPNREVDALESVHLDIAQLVHHPNFCKLRYVVLPDRWAF
jgi:hypothetical protein